MALYAQICSACGHEFEIIRTRYEDPRPCPECHSLDTDQVITAAVFKFVARDYGIKRGPSHNPYQNLTLQHIRGEDGKPITVNSEAELHAAEKKYNFIHAASYGAEKEAPQHASWAGDITHGKPRIWNHDPAAYVNPGGVSTGLAADPHKDTIVDLPNAI